MQQVGSVWPELAPLQAVTGGLPHPVPPVHVLEITDHEVPLQFHWHAPVGQGDAVVVDVVVPQVET